MEKSCGGTWHWWPAAIVLPAVFVLYFLIAYFTPLQREDWMFIDMYARYSGGTGAYSIGALIDFMRENRLTDNARIANTAVPFLISFPPFPLFRCVVTAAAMAALVWLTGRMGAGRTSFGSLSIAWLMLIVALPWRDEILVTSLMSNYLLSAVINLVYICWYIRLVNGRRRNYSIGNYLTRIAFTIVAAGWHEGFAVPTAAALAALLTGSFHKKGSNIRAGIYFLALYCVAAAAFALSPGTLSRMSAAGGMPPVTLKSFVMLNFMSVGVLALLAVRLGFEEQGCRGRLLKDLAADPVLRAMVPAMCAGLVVYALIGESPRVAFYPQLCAVIACMRLIYRKREAIGAKTYISIAVFAMCVVQTVSVAVWQQRLDRQDREIMALYKTSADGTVFYDLMPPAQVPWYTMYMPTRFCMYNDVHYRCFNFGHAKKLKVVPTALRDNPYEKGIPVEGLPGTGTPDSPIMKLRRVGDVLVAPYSPGQPRDLYGQADMEWADGTVAMGTNVLSCYFRTPTGDEYLCIVPLQTAFGRLPSLATLKRAAITGTPSFTQD